LIIRQEPHKERGYRVEQVSDVMNEIGRIEHIKYSFQALNGVGEKSGSGGVNTYQTNGQYRHNRHDNYFVVIFVFHKVKINRRP